MLTSVVQGADLQLLLQEKCSVCGQVWFRWTRLVSNTNRRHRLTRTNDPDACGLAIKPATTPEKTKKH